MTSEKPLDNFWKNLYDNSAEINATMPVNQYIKHWVFDSRQLQFWSVLLVMLKGLSTPGI